MKNKKLKNKKRGRPKYVPNIEKLRELYKKIDNNELTNEQCWKIARLSVRPCGLKWSENIKQNWSVCYNE